jgi:hypothetical protein
MYPSDIRVFIDGRDVTKWIFGTETVTLTNVNRDWKNIDISSFIRGPGLHKIEVTAGAGVGRVEARVSID